MKPVVTIGVACFNAEATIEAAIRSAIAQDMVETEIIVVDDASTDRSAEIIQGVAAGDKRVRVYQQRVNQGAAAAYNVVIEAARGDYIMFVDADDRALPRRARATAEALDDFGRPALCFCDRFIGQEGGRVVQGLRRRFASPREFEAYMLDAVCLHHAERFYRANTPRFQALRQHGLGGSSAGSGVMTASTTLLREFWFDPSLRRFCDTELNLRAASHGVAAIGLRGPLAVQTLTGGAEKSAARRRKFTGQILAKHEAAFRRFGVAYPGHHHARPAPVSPALISRTPRATVGLLTFDCEETLPRAIESARAQTVDDIEIVILDDASTDATVEIARSYDDRRISVLESPWNLGAGANRNRLASEARGEFLAFFDDDDAALPQRLEIQVADLLASERRSISIASAFRHHNGKLTEAHRSLGPYSAPIEAEQAERLVWRTILQHSEGKKYLDATGLPQARYALGTSLMCARTRVFRDIRFDPDMRRMQDLELLARFTAGGGCLIPTETPLVDVFVTASAEKKWSKVVEYNNRILEKHDGALERLFGVSTADIQARNRTRLPVIRAWEGVRSAFGY